MLTRSGFLAATAAAQMVAAAAPAAATTAAPGRYVFDRARFATFLAKPAKHRQVIAWPTLKDGAGLHYAENALAAYADGFGEGPGTLHVALVLYGSALAALLPDALWKTYSLETFLPKIGEKLEKNGERNLYLTRVLALAQGGVTFFVCNNALHGITEALASNAEAHGAGTDQLYAAFAEAIAPLPSAQIVPAGIAALDAAQEARFTFFQASL